MNIFSKSLWFAGIFNMIFGSFLTIVDFCSKNALKGGTELNQAASVFWVEAFFLMLIAIVIFSFIIGENKTDYLLSLKWYDIFMYIVLGANALYRFFPHGDTATENGVSITREKIMAGIALSLILNLTICIITRNFMKDKKSRED